MKNIVELKNAEIISVSGGVRKIHAKKRPPAKVSNSRNWSAIILGAGMLVATGAAAYFGRKSSNLSNDLNTANTALNSANADIRKFDTIIRVGAHQAHLPYYEYITACTKLAAALLNS